MVAVLRPDRCARRLHRELPARAVEPLHLDAGEGRRAAALEIQDMRAAVRDDLLARSAVDVDGEQVQGLDRSEEHTSELQSLMRISYAVFCLKKKTKKISTQLTTSR